MTDSSTAVAVKPGWKTSEFYLSAAAMLVSLLYASGVIGDASMWGKALAFIAAALTSMGYAVSRATVKTGS